MSEKISLDSSALSLKKYNSKHIIEENSNGYNFSHLLDMYNFICSNILSFFICSKDTIFSCKNYRLLMIII